MRTIKFRAWAHASKTMFYPNSDDGWELCNGILSPLPNTTLMQFTGLKDKNGKEIYGGDICDFASTLGRRLIVWEYDRWKGKCIEDVKPACQIIGEPYRDTLKGSNCSFPSNTEKYCEVIGNIHSNPDLLKNSEK